MVKIKNSLSSKLLSVLLVLSILVGLIPSTIGSVFAADDSVGTIEALVSGGSVDENTGVVSFSTGCELDWSPADHNVNRWTDGWWVGIKVTAPEGVDISDAKYQNKTSAGWDNYKLFAEYKDSKDGEESQYITLWGIVNESYINDAILNGKEYLEYGYQFDWDGNDVYEQPVSMRVYPDEIVLKKDGVQVYPKASGLADVEMITPGISAENNGSNIVVVENTDNVELDWSAADTAIGRNQDGWWIGFNVTAPDYADQAKASYQYKTASGWEATSHSFVPDIGKTLQVWRLVNEAYLDSAVENYKNINYITRYDWDGDGVYEQIIHLKIDPSKVTLVKGDEQVYPYLGTVTPLTGGTVSGNTSNLELRIEKATLNWSPKDESIGRNYDGWWVGMKVTAPEGYTAEQLKNAFYNRRVTDSTDESGWGKYQKIMFNDTKDSDSEIQLWMVITPALVAKYEKLGKEIATEYVFDWDGTGDNVQTITMTVVPGADIVLNKVSQTGVAFAEPDPVDKWVKEPYTNTLIGGQGSGSVTYAITDGTDVADIDEKTGELTFKKPGTVQVTATKAGDDTYEAASATYTVKAIKFPQAEFKFENSNSDITVEFSDGAYTNTALGGSGDGDIEYSVVSGTSVATIDKNTGKLSFLKAGEVVIVAKKIADDNYVEATATYTLNIKVSEQAALEFKPSVPAEITYSTKPQFVFEVVGGSGEGEVTYSVISGNEYATIDKDTGAITTIKAGGSFTVQVDKAADDGYNAATPITATIYVKHSDQSGFGFAEKSPTNVTFNDNNNVFNNVASDGESTGAISYALADVESDDIADIDSATGEVTIHAAGTINVVATKAGDDCYNETTATYSLVVEKDDPEFAVEDVELVYGVTKYQIDVETTLGGAGRYVYSIEGNNDIGASVDNNGLVSFVNSDDKVGSITIKVKKEADNQYNALEKSFTLAVSYYEPEAEPEVSGDTKNESGWYTGVVTITAPVGHEISYANDLTGVEWTDSVEVNTDGDNSKNVYLKKGNKISDAITFESIKIDTEVPVNVEVKYDNTFIEKVLSGITFGIYEADSFTVTLTAEDVTSGVDNFTYDIGNGKVVVEREDFTKYEDGVAEYSFTVGAQFRNKVKMTATDVAGWTVESDSKHTLVGDTVSPVLDVKYEFKGEETLGDVIYTNGDVIVKFEINEDNFDIRLNSPVFMIGSQGAELSWNYSKEDKLWTAEYPLSGDGIYDLSLAFADSSANAMVLDGVAKNYKQKIVIDSVKPVFTSNYGDVTPFKENIYNEARTATFTVTESNFDAEDVVLTVTAKDITGADVDISSKAYAEYAKDPANWTPNATGYSITLPAFDIDAAYTVDIKCTDLANNESVDYNVDGFIFDDECPANLEIEYSTSIIHEVLDAVTFGIYDKYFYYKNEVIVTVSADDIISGVDHFDWKYTKESGASDKNADDYGDTITEQDIKYSNKGRSAKATFSIRANARGYVSVDVFDRANNKIGEVDAERINVVDDKVPERTVSFSDAKVLDRETKTAVGEYAEGDNVILYYETEAEVTIRIDEANFYSDDVKVILEKNGVETTPDVKWADESADIHVGKFTISGEGDYLVKVSYTDRSKNEMESYTSQEIRIDDTDPTVAIDFDPELQATNGKYFNKNREATITIVDHNFLADDVVAEITAKDVKDNDIKNADAICKEFADYLKNRDNWTSVGDVHTAKITFRADAQYTFKVDYKDIIGNIAETEVANPFVVDHEKPVNVDIKYSDSIISYVIKAITFGFYNPKVAVTLTADDITSGVDYFEMTYTQEDDTSNKNTATYTEKVTTEDIEYSNSGMTATAVVEIPASARGNVSVVVADRADNKSTKEDSQRINVVDNIAPDISVNYEADSTDTKVQFVDNDRATVDTFDKASNAFYNGDVTAKIVIDEANFFDGIKADDGIVIHSVGIKLTKTDDDGYVTVYEYLPEGADQKYEDAIPVNIEWTNAGDKHSFDINYTDNADYVLEIEYTDLSGNDAGINANDGSKVTKHYESKVVTVDKIAPVVSVKYSNDNVVHTIDGRDYLDDVQSATITVREHNFRADDFAANVLVKDILGNDVKAEDYKNTLSDDSNWTKSGNTYTITVDYSVDANYSFDYEYADLAQNAAADYNEDLFTVDTTAPGNLTVSYSTSVLERVLESVTFGYYDAQMTVTISAEDDTAGVYYFIYSYIKSEGVSEVNAELIDDIIEDANNRIVHDGKKSTTSFVIPKLLLKNDNQFNGTVKFTAYDRSENNTEKVDNHRVIVDNIAPTATITYNQPVQNVNNISYYNGNINAKIVVNEANFYSEDVAVRVTINGQNYPVAVNWVDDSTDVHTGTFTLTHNGDYIVVVEYNDRSGNEMTTYTSNRLTLDTKAPTVNVTNIKSNFAKKDEKYGFTITAKDINLNAASFKPVLTATVRNEDGSYEIKNVTLGDMKTVEAGKEYYFEVDNLEEDAIYSLVCTLNDMSGNAYSKLILDDSKEYDEVRFSINRNGSTFAVDKDTDELVKQYFVYSVEKDVVIEEVNVDPVETYAVKLNGEELTEGEDYTTTMTDKEGEWSKRTYVISKSLFEAEGEYNIVVESVDKTKTTAYSDVKNLNVSFVVDRTAPVLTISGLENSGRYQVEEQTVTVIPTDDGGRLYSIKVVVMDSDGNPLKDENGKDISVRFEMSGEEFLTYLAENDEKITFTVPEGLENQVKIICNDCAVNADGKTNEYNETFTKVTVSQSGWIIFYANKPLFYGSIAGVLLLVGGIVALIVIINRKKEKKK